MRTKTFKVGDRVKWTSQASGSWRKKVGTVVEVLPPGLLSKLVCGYNRRKVESYVVAVPGKTDLAAKRILFPIPKLLKKAGGEKMGSFAV